MNEQPTYTDPQERLQEIRGLLNAYRQGWIVYDAGHVADLQRERIALEKQPEPADQ